MEQLCLFTRGDAEKEQMLARIFSEQAALSLAALETALAGDDAEGWSLAAHRFKGASGSFGAVRVFAMCREAELQSYHDGQGKREILLSLRDAVIQIETFFRDRWRL